MYNGQKVKELLRDKGVNNTDVIHAMGWKCNHQLTQVMDGNPKADTLEKLCDFLEIPIDALFDRPDYSMGNNEISSREAKLLKLVQQQKKIIDTLHELLDDLKGEK